MAKTADAIFKITGDQDIHKANQLTGLKADVKLINGVETYSISLNQW